MEKNENEIQIFIKIWLTATASLIFSHQIATRTNGGAATKLLIFLPVIYLFTTLPLQLTTFHLAGPTIFYLVWLANFKLILFSFNQGPLYTTPPLSLLHFTSITLLPIKTKSINPSKHVVKKSRLLSLTIFVTKCVMLTLIITSFRYIDVMHKYLKLLLYSFHVYIATELILAVSTVPVRVLFGFDIERQFDEPYLATSLQDFWGYRWNLMVTSILRPSVYLPVRGVCVRVLGRKWAMPVAVLMTFVVSGLMHEVIYYYFIRVAPTWEVTCFFVLHGVCVALEVALKMALGDKWRLPVAVSRVMTLGFVVATSNWLFFPQMTRNGVDLRAIDEYWIMLRFVRDKLGI